MDIMVFERHGHFKVVEDVNNSLGDLGTDAVARKQHNFLMLNHRLMLLGLFVATKALAQP